MKRRFERAANLIVGTIGQPGEREFYLQFFNESEALSFAVEKQQVSALVERFNILLKDLKSRGIQAQPTKLPNLEVPLISEFVVSEISISWNLDLKRIHLYLSDEDASNEVDVFLTPDNISSFMPEAIKVIASGRAICPFCSLPINRDGHLCPRANGYRR